MNLAAIEPPKSAPRIGDAGRQSDSASSRHTVLAHWLILLLSAAVVTGIMWAPAMLAGHSAWMDVARMAEFDSAFRAGDLWPIWSPDFYFGHGSPLFQFYAPLAYFFTEIPVRAGLEIATALKLTQLLALFASGIAMYQLAARHLSGWAACFGGILYMVAPYRLVDIFVRHALAEHCSFVWLPLIVLGTERYVVARCRRGLAIGILATAGLALTHNVMTLIGLPVCVAAGWLLGARSLGVRAVVRAGIPAMLGIGLVTFFWWPALDGRSLTFAEESLTGGYFDYQRHFVDLPGLLSFDWGFGESGPAAAEKMPLQIGLPHLLAVALGVFAMFKNSRGDLPAGRLKARWICAGVAIAAGAILMCHAGSQPVWGALPLVKYVQFPWRFLGLVVFGTALCGAGVLDQLGAARPRWEKPVFLAGVVTIFASYFPCYSAARFLVLDRRNDEIARVTPAGVGALKAVGALASASRLITPGTIRATGERATSGDDFLPRGVQEKPTVAPSAPFVTRGGEVREWTRVAQNHYRANISMAERGPVQLQQFWFPGWSAWIDGEKAATAPAGKAGVVSCEVPFGDHIVEFRYLGLPQRRTGMLISWLSAAVAVVTIFGGGWFRRWKGRAS